MSSSSDESLKAFGARIRQARSRRGWSQERLAFECGLDRSYVGGVERGDRNVSAKNILKLAQSLEVPPGQLLKIEGSLGSSRKKARNRRGK